MRTYMSQNMKKLIPNLAVTHAEESISGFLLTFLCRVKFKDCNID